MSDLPNMSTSSKPAINHQGNGVVDNNNMKLESKTSPYSSGSEGSDIGAPEHAPKVIIATKVSGTVKWFNVKSGYGFINRSDTQEDVFVHQTAIVKNNPRKAVRSVGDGEVVEFDVVVGEKGNEASNVTGPGGSAVQGSAYAADRRRGGYRRGGRGGRGWGTRRPKVENGFAGHDNEVENDSEDHPLPQRGGGRYGGVSRRSDLPQDHSNEGEEFRCVDQDGDDANRRGGRGGRGNRGFRRSSRSRGGYRGDDFTGRGNRGGSYRRTGRGFRRGGRGGRSGDEASP